MRNFILLFVLVVSINSFGQSDSLQQVVQFSGVVVTGDSLNPVPFTTVYRERDQRGTITDSYGFFSIPTFVGDTIRFSCIGYMKSEYVIPDSLANDRYNIVQVLGRDTVMVSTTFIYPYPTKERFRQEFLALDLADSKEELAKKNLEAALLYERMQESGMSASENYRYAVQQQSRQISYAGQMPTISLLSPIAWAQFIEAWRSGAFKRQ